MMHIINISHKTFFPDTDELIKQIQSNNGNYDFEYIPTVLVNEKIKGSKDISITKFCEEILIRNFSLYEGGTSFVQLKNFFKEDFDKNDLLLAKKAFQKLKTLAVPFSERVIADFCCQIILNKLKNIENDEIIFFIEKLSTDKMLGRLGYLYLNLEKITICFLSIDPDDLLTTVMSKTTGKLNFDLFRLISPGSVKEKFGPYPGCSEDALEQTFFYSSQGDVIKKRPSPIRFDIFSQGLSEKEIEEKGEKIKCILEDSNETLLYEINNYYTINVPAGFKIAKDAWKEEKFSKEEIKELAIKNKKKFESNGNTR